MNTETPHVSPGFQFASDNTAGICPEAWTALAETNRGYAASYGADSWTARASDLIRTLFERPAASVFFVLNGTASNALSLSHLARSYHGIVCHEAAHVQSDECGAPEFFSGGAKLVALPGAGGKLSPAALQQLIDTRDELHFPKPRALSPPSGVLTIDRRRSRLWRRWPTRTTCWCTWTVRVLPTSWRPATAVQPLI
jgi:threonine aldolase